jgi:hypothetical protein
MIVPYGSDEEIKKSKDENNNSQINEKDIKLENLEVSVEIMKNNNIFQLDVILKNFY